VVAAGGSPTMPWRGPLSVTVPGAVDGWFAALQRFGALPADVVFARAIDLAENGVPVTPGLAAWIARDAAPILLGWRSDPGAFLPAGRPPEPGDLLRQPDLARTYRLLAREGPDAFYRGPLGRAVVDDVRRRGGVLQVEDLERHASRWATPLSASYRGHEVFTFPPPSQGIAALAALNVLDGLDVRALGHHTPRHVHLLVEAARLAGADRDAHVSDPEFADVPVDRLLGAEHALELRDRLDPRRALPSGGGPADRGGDTVVACAIDGRGSLAVLMQSLGSPFGSGVLVAGTGLLLHNRGSYFSLDPRHVNFLQPRKRTMHTFAPAIVCRRGMPVVGLGSIGGDVQPQVLLQVLSAILDFDHDAQRAIVAPRWRSRRLAGTEAGGVRELNGQREVGGTPSEGLLCEDRFPEATLQELRGLGHRVLVRGPWDPSMGPTQAVAVRPESGVREGAFDPRTDGLALGW
jgi:gamma-glutamyltranspeptidase/glutathione hydrolase